MRHPTDDCWLEIARGGEAPEAADHASSCPVCAGRLADWRRIVAGLTEFEANPLDDGERHLLATLARFHGASRPLRIASLLQTTVAAPAAVRGVQARLWEFEAGTTRLTLQARDDAGSVALLGQITEGELPWSTGTLAACGDDGSRQEAMVDTCGEFAFALRPGRYRIEVERGEAGLVIPFVDLDPERES